MDTYRPAGARARSTVPRSKVPRSAVLGLLTVLATLVAVLTSPPAAGTAAAPSPTGFHEVTGFGVNPGNLRMFAYVPVNAGPGAPVVVLFHGCGGSAGGLDVDTGWRKYAEAYGFAVVLPEQKAENVGSGGLVPHTCFSAWNPEDRTRAGQGEARSVVEMVHHMTTAYGADPDRVYVTGYSGGGAATNVMMAAYPDVFRAGAVFFGMAYGCADTEADYFDTGLFARCPGAFNTLSPQEWGNRIRAAHPGYGGPRPRVQIWHGGSDPLINKNSLEKQRDGWTDVLGVSRVPASTTRPALGVTRQICGAGQVETYLIDRMGHEAPVDPGTGIDKCGSVGQGHDSLCGPYHAARFFGLG
ncbi:extracellular catalytic domain type 1 short-chain-length polyhydroxyalkanoate depolymerase [Streptomyces abyssomicinicus]|uniref:extracellular catalytic domain type 1 short-chain-length polyhydroxyalkanoate depolymerase n=1 Tax=Streptomyces abyssomicinicus TaxID=574929 RepID=UPI001250A755|nr:PHB depolymerase family esterase [Streptomyces abyssomicinicus]